MVLPPRCKSIRSKKTAESFSARHARLQHGNRRLQHGLLLLQNWDISKSRHDQVHSQSVSPEEVPLLARKHNCASVASPTTSRRFGANTFVDICKAAKSYGLKTVMVTNGYITREAFHDIYDHVDAANVDLKAFTETFYGKITLTAFAAGAGNFAVAKNETNVWFEITNLMIPTLNDDVEETRRLAGWILENLGPDVPLHFTAFHPDFKLQDKPRTPPEALHRARAIALEAGLHFVYEGNIYSDGANTNCPKCRTKLIQRSWHTVEENLLRRDGACPKCNFQIAGILELKNSRGKRRGLVSVRFRLYLRKR